MLRALQTFPLLLLMAALWDEHSYLNSSGKEVGAQRGKGSCLRLHSRIPTQAYLISKSLHSLNSACWSMACGLRCRSDFVGSLDIHSFIQSPISTLTPHIFTEYLLETEAAVRNSGVEKALAADARNKSDDPRADTGSLFTSVPSGW